MTGEEHRQAAEQLLSAHSTHLGDKPYATDILIAAQVHAILALVSAVLHGKPRDTP